MVALTYPGVYLEEAPGGPPPITGVATSIAAFVGWSNKGPVGKAVMVESWAQYQALYGGLIPGIYLGYAVYQFFQNGGSQAYIVRLYDTTTAATASAVVGGLTLYASSPGLWGNGLCVGVTQVTLQPDGSYTFNLQVFMLTPGGAPTLLESYTNLSTSQTNPQYAVTIVDSDSNYITFTPPGGTAPNTALSVTATSPSWIASGYMTSGSPAFTSGEGVTQTGSGATDNLLNLGVVTTASSSYIVFSAAPATATPTGTGAWTAGTSSFTPTSVPVQVAAVPLMLGGSTTPGNDGTILAPVDTPLATAGNLFETALGSATIGYQLLAKVPIFNLLCVPGETYAPLVTDMQQFCDQWRAFLIVDSALAATVNTGAATDLNTQTNPVDGEASPASLVSQYADHAAFYFPWVLAPDPAQGYRSALFPPSGFVAGIYAATDASRGVWKAPAGVATGLTGVLGLQYNLSDADSGVLNPIAVNCLRQLPTYGTVVWGSRTIAGEDAAGSQWKYVPIRRLALFLESSLYVGTQWAVFEPNAAPLWSQVRLSIGSFMQGLFLQGAFAGTTPQQAYFVKCDADNNPPASVALGILNITVGFAPLYPAEFIVIQIQQMTQS